MNCSDRERPSDLGIHLGRSPPADLSLCSRVRDHGLENYEMGLGDKRESWDLVLLHSPNFTCKSQFSF